MPVMIKYKDVANWLGIQQEWQTTQSRAVAVALITANSARMKKALSTILEEARNLNDANLQEVETMHEALSHYRGVPEQWKSFSISLKRTIKDIYFNLIITFLDCRDNFSDLQCIIHQKDIPLEDRIAFAAIHFSDQYFMKSVKELMTEGCLNRTLSGLLITGISYHKATHDLLSRYVDYTGDIQTATVLLAVGRCFVKNPSFSLTLSAEEIASADFEVLVIEDTEICVEMDDYMKRSCSIVYDYLDMLNTWRLWMQRARLDCLLGWKRDPTFLEFKFEQNTVQTEVCCQFCPQSIALEKSDITTSSASSTVLASASRSSVPSSSSSNTSTATAREISCPHCLKPLPKCILCHRHMGSYVQTECRKLGRLSSWFTWCQKCRHGGHMVHLWHWFNSHDECAASGCSCQCNIEDFGIFPMNAESTDQCLFCEDMY